MSREIFFISDTHFGHANIIKFANRPFANVTEMDEALLSSWNETVGVGDIVYHLGDVYFDQGWKSFDRVHGTVELIMGNHDHPWDKPIMNRVNKIHWWKKFVANELNPFVLTHAPLERSQLINYHLTSGPKTDDTKFKDEPANPIYFTNVHGHIHDKYSPAGPYLNISVEQTDYKPIHIDELRLRIKNLHEANAILGYIPYA